MARSQHKSQRKTSGGRYSQGSRAKKKSELAGFPTNTRLGETKTKSKRVLGGNNKKSLLSAKFVNVSDKKGKVTKTEIVNVIENPANPHLVRRNVLTKGAIVETKLGKVKITSRPGQETIVNGVLL